MRLLVTGGCGFLGANLSAEALRRGDDLFVLDNLSRAGSSSNLDWLQEQGAFRHFHADIRNANDVDLVIRETRPDAVFHLAGQVAMTTSIANPRNDFEVNALGTFHLLEAVRAHAPEAGVIYSSTNKVYGDLEQFEYVETDRRYECRAWPGGFPETVSLDFRSPYGCSKGAADQYMLDYHRVFGLRTVVFRHSSMYGGRQYATYDQGWIGWFCSKALEAAEGRGNSFTISGNGKQVRDVLYSSDMVRLYYQALEHLEKAAGHAFNVGGGMTNSLSLLELLAMLEKALDTKLSFTHLPVRASDQKVFVADTAKAHRLLGWQPEVTRERGIASMLDWIREARQQS